MSSINNVDLKMREYVTYHIDSLRHCWQRYYDAASLAVYIDQ